MIFSNANPIQWSWIIQQIRGKLDKKIRKEAALGGRRNKVVSTPGF